MNVSETSSSPSLRTQHQHRSLRQHEERQTTFLNMLLTSLWSSAHPWPLRCSANRTAIKQTSLISQKGHHQTMFISLHRFPVDARLRFRALILAYRLIGLPTWTPSSMPSIPLTNGALPINDSWWSLQNPARDPKQSSSAQWSLNTSVWASHPPCRMSESTSLDANTRL